MSNEDNVEPLWIDGWGRRFGSYQIEDTGVGIFQVEPGDRVRITIEMTVNTAEHFAKMYSHHLDGSEYVANPNGGFSSLTYKSGRHAPWDETISELKDSIFTVEFPDQPEGDTTVDMEVLFRTATAARAKERMDSDG